LSEFLEKPTSINVQSIYWL